LGLVNGQSCAKADARVTNRGLSFDKIISLFLLHPIFDIGAKIKKGFVFVIPIHTANHNTSKVYQIAWYAVFLLDIGAKRKKSVFSNLPNNLPKITKI
jgi:hypothetical protein